MVYDPAYSLQTSSTASSRSGVNRPTGYMSLTGTNKVCGETITSTLHIIARAEGWGLQAMPPQPLQTVWLGNSSFWFRNLVTNHSGSPLLDPVHDAGITGSFFGSKSKELRKADHATRTTLFHRALQVTVVYIPFNIHSNHWVYFKIELATNTITLHDPLPPLRQTQAEDTKQILDRLAEWVIQVKRKRMTNAHLALPTVEAFPVLSEPASSFRTVTSITQKHGFQCAVICIGNIMAGTSNKQGRVRSRYCENIRKYIGLLLWLNSQQPIVLSQEHMILLAQYSPSGSVIGIAQIHPGALGQRPHSRDHPAHDPRNRRHSSGDNCTSASKPLSRGTEP